MGGGEEDEEGEEGAGDVSAEVRLVPGDESKGEWGVRDVGRGDGACRCVLKGGGHKLRGPDSDMGASHGRVGCTGQGRLARARTHCGAGELCCRGCVGAGG